MNQHNRDTAVGVFANRAEAETAIHELRRAGFRDQQMGVAMGGTSEGGSQTAAGAAAGAVGGGALGALAGMAVVAGLIPAIGPAIAGGLLASLLASSAVGAAAGGLLGALAGMGVPEEEARFYETELAAGRALVVVRTDGRFNQAVDILNRCGAMDTTSRYAGAADTR